MNQYASLSQKIVPSQRHVLQLHRGALLTDDGRVGRVDVQAVPQGRLLRRGLRRADGLCRRQLLPRYARDGVFAVHGWRVPSGRVHAATMRPRPIRRRRPELARERRRVPGVPARLVLRHRFD